MGVFLDRQEDRLISVATDGRQMSYWSERVNGVTEPTDERDSHIIIPSSSLSTLIQCLKAVDGDENVEIWRNKTLLRFKILDTIFDTKLIDGVYPNWRRALPKEDSFGGEFLISNAELTETLKTAQIFSDVKDPGVRLTFANESLTIRYGADGIGAFCGTIGYAQSRITPDLAEEREVILNCAILLNILRSHGGDKIKIKISENPGVS